MSESKEFEERAAHDREINLDIPYSIVEGCPECGGPVKFWVGDMVGKCLKCGRDVNVIEPW